MKEYKKLPQFMGGWYIDKKLTNQLIKTFDFKDLVKKIQIPKKKKS